MAFCVEQSKLQGAQGSFSLFLSSAVASEARRLQFMFGRSWSTAAALWFLLAGVSTTLAQPPAANPPARNSAAKPVPQTLSPLHAFLGIDPVTGEFKPANASPPRATPPRATTPQTIVGKEGTGRPVDTADTEKSGAESPLRDILNRAAQSGELPPGDTPIGDTTFDDLRAEITKAIDARDEHALTEALTRVTRGFGTEGLAIPGMNYAQALTLALLIYPLGIALGAFYAAWAGRRRDLRTDRDRRHDARQLRRRLALAGSIAATIGLCWWAGECNFWLSEPTKLLAAVSVVTVLLLISAGLRLLISRAAASYSRRTIEDLRFQHAALCEEVKELRKRVQGDGIPEAV
jgi:hypothetical protein